MIARHIDGGAHEDIGVANNSQNFVRFNLEIAIRADFADIFEVKSERIVPDLTSPQTKRAAPERLC
jgi:hypothetical protein